MKLCIDDANVAKIRKIYEYYPVDGVSTNPSILAKTGRSPYEVLKEIRSIVGDGELFVQAVSPDAEGIVREAHRIVKETGEGTLVKIPCVPEGFKAMKALKALYRHRHLYPHAGDSGGQVRRGICGSLCQPHRQHGL